MTIMIKPRVLPLPDSGAIAEIIHLADIHIRVGDKTVSRYDEYMGVFTTLLADLSIRPAIQSKAAVIVIAGDLFHTKNRVEMLAMKMFHFLINGLADLAPVYIIQGNHDYVQEKPEIPDLIASMLLFCDNPRIVYMADTGLYAAGDVLFGVVAIRETLLAGAASGQVDALPPFPQSNAHWRVKAALFHGTITGTKMNENRIATKGYPLEWFAGYDIGLFGDIHKQQINGGDTWNGKQIAWGYPGSLVQQNYGESLWGHGYLAWDLTTRSVIAHHVRNAYGRCYIHVGELAIVTVPNLQCGLSAAIARGLIPANINYRLQCAVKGELGGVARTLADAGIKAHLDYVTVESATIHAQVFAPDTRVADVTANADSFIEFVNSHAKRQALPVGFDWEDYVFRTPERLLYSGFANDAMKKYTEDKNRTVQGCIRALAVYDAPIVKRRFALVHLSWSYLLAYGENCWIDFTTLDRCVCLINGANNAGKSSIMEIILLALYGDTMSSRTEKHTGEVINKNKPASAKSQVTIDFVLGDSTYRIHSAFTEKKSAGGSNNRDTNIILSRVMPHPEQMHSGTKAVKDWVKAELGSSSDFLMSCMLSQSADDDFFKCKDQKEKLTSAFNLRYIELLHELLSNARSLHTQIQERLQARRCTLLEILKMENADDDALRALVVKAPGDYPLCDIREQLAITKRRLESMEAHYLHELASLGKYRLTYAEVMATPLADLKAQLVIAKDAIRIAPKKRTGIRAFCDQVFDTLSLRKISCESDHINASAIMGRLRDDRKAAMERIRAIGDIYGHDVREVMRTYRDSRESLAAYNKLKSNCMLDNRGYGFYEPHDVECPIDESTILAVKAELIQWMRANEELSRVTDDQKARVLARMNELGAIIDELRIAGLIHNRKSPGVFSEARYDACVSAIMHLDYTPGDLIEYCRANPLIAPLCSRDEIAFMQKQLDAILETYPAVWLNAGDIDSCNANDMAILGELRSSLNIIVDRLNRYRDVVVNAECAACLSHPWNAEYMELIRNREQYQRAANIYSARLGDATYIPPAHLSECKSVRVVYRDLKERIEGQEEAHRAYECARGKHALNAELRAMNDAAEWKRLAIQYEVDLADAQCEYDTIKRHSEAHSRFMGDYDEKRQLLDAIDEHLAFIDREFDEARLAYMICHIQEEAIASRIDYYDGQRAAKNEVARLELLISKRPVFDDYVQVKARMSELQTQHDNKLSENAGDDGSRESNILKVLDCSVHIAHAERVKSALILLDDMHKEYKNWIFAHKILPRVTNQVSELLRVLMGGDTQYRLCAYIEGDAIQWTEYNGTCEVSLSKVGGFHRAIIAFLFRIVLQYMGHGAKIQNAQLLLDEAFVAADADNLARVPIFIKRLIDEYHMFESILIVSHQEILRQGCNYTMDIVQSNLFSTLRCGSECAIVSVVKPPTRSVVPVRAIEARNDKCVAITAKGNNCANVAKIGDLCKVHAKK